MVKRRQFLGGCGALALAACNPTVIKPTPIVKTHSGSVQGDVVQGVHRFLGIPYAAPPFGQYRFRSPAEPASWQGVFPATQYGPICPQTGGIQLGLPDEGEDCLNLNVWTPDPGNRSLPVMVWAHGGGQVSGSGANRLYDGTHFAREGVVLVTCNRRLGAEGFLYLEELVGDGLGPGNLGIQDLGFVLQWVQKNISNFGGDPNNVTLFGESGGGAAVHALLATRGSEGLFHRIISQSGGHAAQRPDTATAIAERVLNHVGIRAGDIDKLQSLPWQTLVEAYDLIDEQALGRPQIYLPVINQHMPIHPVDASFKGIGHSVDYLIGHCRDEARLFSAILPSLEDSVFYRRANQIILGSGQAWSAVQSSYQKQFPNLDEGQINIRIVGDAWFRIPSLRIAAGRAESPRAKTFVYQFDWESPLIGAAHSLDLMVFGNGLPFSPLAGFADYSETSSRMRRAWVNFAVDGQPSTPDFEWNDYSEEQSVVHIDETFSTTLGPPPELQPLARVLSQDWLALDL